MMRFLSALIIILATSGALHAQPAADRDLELVLLTRTGFINGINLEYAATPLVVPWVSVRYGKHDATCADFTSSSCGEKGTAALAGARVRTTAGKLEPYVTLGAGNVWWDNTPTSDITGNVHLGVVFPSCGRNSERCDESSSPAPRLRGRIEFGFESNVSPWFNLGIGFML
jgi:hypothetical protein